MVNNYFEYEQTTYKNLTPKDAITVATLYPELSSNVLVQEQIKIYKDNINKITSLKEKQIDLKPKKWWLYFGE